MLERTQTVARRLAAKLPGGACVDAQDLYQEGVVGLLEACDRYDPGQGASLETYAFARVRGAMIDLLRKVSWAGRGWMRGNGGQDVVMLSLDAPAGEGWEGYGEGKVTLGETLAGSLPCPEVEVAMMTILEALPPALEMLPARERHIFELKHIGDRSDKDIARLMHVTPSRITQLRHQAYARIKSSLKVMEPGDERFCEPAGSGYSDSGCEATRIRAAAGRGGVGGV